jgi:NADH:ubiquinone oxidoreductase subunit F (NADH-binding)
VHAVRRHRRRRDRGAAAGRREPYIDLTAYRATGGYARLAECVEGRRSADERDRPLEHAGLRGLGGAGFPAGRKWRIVRGQPAPRLMAVNIDEGEPGTFKDRALLERDPHRFLEGMLIAAWAVGRGRPLHLPARRVPRLPRAARGRTRVAA